MYCYAQVIIHFAKPSEIDKPFTYKIGENLLGKLQVGHRVKVPFGRYNALQIGYVIALLPDVVNSKLRIKTIDSYVEEEPILSSIQIDIARFMVDYYSISFAAAIQLVLPPGLTKKPFVFEKEQEEWMVLNGGVQEIKEYIAANKHKKTFQKQQQVLNYLLEYQSLPKKYLLQQNVSQSAIHTLAKNNKIKSIYKEVKALENKQRLTDFKVLTKEQQMAFDALCKLRNQKCYQTVLLEGVTGSGKTEVFLHVMREVLREGHRAIVLVPEIALTDQTIRRFRERFGESVALTHSRMTAKERQTLYAKVKRGEVSIVVGPRSAVFMPLEDVKLIVVDEEHEVSYKSETTPKYHAIDIAKIRMQKEKGIVLLASATPSLETHYLCETKEYDKLLLQSRIGEAILPEVTLIDMKEELKNGNGTLLSKALYDAIQTTLEQGKQVMLLINRRGYSTLLNCRNCGYVVKCKHCDVAMTYHASKRILVCHYCGKTMELPKVCPKCGGAHIKYLGAGTEKVEEFIMQAFCDYGVGRMDFDTTSGKTGHVDILNAFRSRKINVLIGTQMIAKGHDFKDVTLVGVLSADTALNREDFRSYERTYQLLTQVIGRAGRGKAKGRVIIQTYNPMHPVLKMIQLDNKEQFYKEQLENRKLMGYPPFSHIFSVLIAGTDEKQVIYDATRLAQYYQYYSQRGKHSFRVVGPSVAPLGKVADEYRWRILLLATSRDALLSYGKYCLNKFYEENKEVTTKIQWDIDPLTLM